jgi:hypothetical protein
LALSTCVWAHASVVVSSVAAFSAPVKLGIRPLAPGKRATCASRRASQTFSRQACFSSLIASSSPGCSSLTVPSWSTGDVVPITSGAAVDAAVDAAAPAIAGVAGMGGRVNSG